MSAIIKIIRKTFSLKYSFAVVGSGPGCFHTIKHLINKFGDNIKIDIFEKDPLPYGLVRSGIAPDHYSMKNVIKDYITILKKHNVNIFCNVEVVEKISEISLQNREVQQCYLDINNLTKLYSGIIISCGAEDEIKLNLPCYLNNTENNNYLGISNELNIRNYFSGKEIVSWYNGQFETSIKSTLNDTNFDKVKDVVIVGNGNVSVDVSRLLIKDIKDLSNLDIPDHVLNKFKERNIDRIHIVGRRGSIQSAFSTKEIKELNKIRSMVLDKEEYDFSKNKSSLDELESKDFAVKRNLTNKFQFIESLERKNLNDINSMFKMRNIFLRYLLEPSKIVVKHINKNEYTVDGIYFMRNELIGNPHEQKSKVIENLKDKELYIKCDLLVSSVGYVSSQPFKSLFKYSKNVVENDKGHIKENIFCSGWYKRGAKGILNETLVDARETFQSIEKNLDKLKESKNDFNIFEYITNKTYLIDKIKCVSLMEKEESDGKKEGKLLKKIISRKEIFNVNI